MNVQEGMLATKEHKQEMGTQRWKTGRYRKGSAKTQYFWKYHKKTCHVVSMQKLKKESHL